VSWSNRALCCGRFGITFAVFAYWLFPVNSLAAPEWDVTVVDEHGKPVEGMTVRETWQNYSVEAHGKATRE